MTFENQNREDFLKALAALIRLFESPDGVSCANNVGVIVVVDEDYYEFDGEKFSGPDQSYHIEKVPNL